MDKIQSPLKLYPKTEHIKVEDIKQKQRIPFILIFVFEVLEIINLVKKELFSAPSFFNVQKVFSEIQSTR